MSPGIGIAIGVPFGNRQINWAVYWAHSGLFLFFGQYKNIAGGRLNNEVTGSTDWLTVAGVAGSETYQVPNTAAYIAADTDFIWFKTDASQRTTTTAELIGYDFTRTLINYDDTNPYVINWIAILNVGVAVTDVMRDSFHLSVWWDNILNAHGNLKGNRGVGQSVWDGYAQDLIARMIVVGETPDASRQIIINNTFKSGRTKPFWAKLDAVWTLAAHGNDSALLNWISSAYDATAQGSPAFQVDRGYTFATGKYLHTGIIPNAGGLKYIQNSATIGAYTRTDVNGAYSLLGTSGGAAAYLGMSYIFNRYVTTLTRINNVGVESSVVNADGKGMYITTRTSSSNLNTYKNITKNPFTVNSNGLSPVEYVIGARNVNGSIAQEHIGQISLAFIGSSFDDTDVADFISVFVDGYLNSIGAKI